MSRFLRKKISIIGSGFVGSSLAQWLLCESLANTVLIDLNKGLAEGRALDLSQSRAGLGADVSITGGSDFNLARDSDIVVITAGLARKPGMSRSDLLEKNAEIMTSICEKLKDVCPDSIFIIVSNPLDAMVYLANKILKPKRENILGMAGVLDTSRYKYFIADKLNVSVKDISALVLGGHGDSMVPLVRYTSVSGIPITELLSEKDIEDLVEQTKKGGATVVSLLKTGSAHYAPSLSVMEMLRACLKDEKRILPCAARLQGEYGETDMFIGVPCLLGEKGVEKIIETKLSDKEKELFKNSVRLVKDSQKEVEKILS